MPLFTLWADTGNGSGKIVCHTSHVYRMWVGSPLCRERDWSAEWLPLCDCVSVWLCVRAGPEGVGERETRSLYALVVQRRRGANHVVHIIHSEDGERERAIEE